VIGIKDCWHENGKGISPCDCIHAFQCGGVIKDKKYSRFSYILCRNLREPIFMEPPFYGSLTKGNIEFEKIYMPNNCPRKNEFNQIKMF